LVPLAEVEQTLSSTSRELTLAGNTSGVDCVVANTLDQRLARADKLQVVPVASGDHTQDMERLRRRCRWVDTQRLSA
jgi:hypothetical protein